MNDRSAAEPTLSKNAEKSRYEATVGSNVVGFAEYAQRDGVVDFTHTFVKPAFRGGDIAGNLVQFALDDVATGDQRVVASCSYVADWISEHPDYQPLLTRG